MLKLKLQYFGHLMQRSDSFEKTLMLGKIEGRRRRGWQRMRWLDSIANSMDMRLSKPRELVMDREACSPWGHKESDTLSNWTELMNPPISRIYCFDQVLSLKLEGWRICHLGASFCCYSVAAWRVLTFRAWGKPHLFSLITNGRAFQL